jgi:2-methylaconitate cis-trans-isomerase PrpF
MGSPDAKQIDGLGGANSLTSKVAIINPSERDDADIDYTFAQVSLNDRVVDMKGNCGNISSAVGPYAIDQGLVPIQEPVTRVRIYNTNTKKIIISEVEVENGQVKTEGTCSIPGVPGTGSPIYLSFFEPEGSVTGKALPTGNPTDVIETAFGTFPISIVDAANPLVYVRAEDIGFTGIELPDEYTDEQLKKLEEIRSIAAELCGFASKQEATKRSPAVPKMTVITAPKDYRDRTGTDRKAEDMDLVIRMMSMQKPHNSLAITGAICTAVAASIPGTLVAQIVSNTTERIRLAHPAGIMETSAGWNEQGQKYVKVVRTARKIMQGEVYTKSSF